MTTPNPGAPNPAPQEGGPQGSPEKFRGAFPVLAGDCNPNEIVVLKSQFDAVARQLAQSEERVAKMGRLAKFHESRASAAICRAAPFLQMTEGEKREAIRVAIYYTQSSTPWEQSLAVLRAMNLGGASK